MNRSDQDRNANMLCGPLAKRGYLRWWHSFSGTSVESGARRHFFVEYLILNPVPERRKKTSVSHPSYVRVSAGVFPSEDAPGLQLHSYYPISSAKFAKKPLYFQVEDQILQENRILGRVSISQEKAERSMLATDAGVMEWKLELHKTIACHTGILASRFFCAINALDSFWHGEGIKTHYRGQVTLNGEVYDVDPDSCDGYADKHWGSSFNKPWLQLASSCLLSERTGKLLKHSSLALDGCCPRFLFFRFQPRLILQLTYTGEDFYYSFENPFRKARMKWGTKESRERYTWHVKAQNQNSLVKLTIRSPKKSMMTLKYDAPDSVLGSPEGSPMVRAGNEGYGTLDLYRLTPEGKVWLDTLTIQNCLCEFEKPAKTASAK